MDTANQKDYPLTQISNPIRNKINKIFDGHFITDSSEALNTISGLYVPNNSNNKRVLVNEIEKRDLLINKAVLDEYAKVKSKINLILSSIAFLEKTVKEMSCRINDSKTKTHHLISQTTNLKKQSKQTEKKIAWVNSLVMNFQLSQEENEHLRNVPIKSPITSDFLLSLAHIENVHEKSKTFVKCWYQTSAYEIMEIVGLQQEVAIEKLYHWTIAACRGIDSFQNTLVPQALMKFQNRQVLFSNIIEEYCTARKTNIVQQFIDVLTKGNDSGSKPIEFYANDAKRYVKDILTWVYSVIPIEKENLLLLLKYCDIIEKNQQISAALTCIVEALCPLLKVRAELILKPDREPLTLWSISNMIIHYKDVIHASLPGGHLIDTLEELLKKSEEVFLIALDSKVQRELSLGVKAPSSDLSPSTVVTDLVIFLRDLLATMTVSSTSDNTEDQKIIFTHILDPLLHAINETACHLSSTDMSVYMLNCIYHVQCTLSLYTIMDKYNERLQAQSEAQIDTLTSEQASYLVANLNLGPIYTILQEKVSGPLSALPGMDISNLKLFLNKFDVFLASPNLHVLQQLNLLISHSHRATVKKRAFDVILAIYSQLYNAVHTLENGYIDPEKIMPRSTGDVSKLLIV